MSNAKKCDRCGKYYDIYDGVCFGDKGLRYHGIQLLGDNAPIFDLCEGCMKTILTWLDGLVQKEAGCCISCKYNDTRLDDYPCNECRILYK